MVIREGLTKVVIFDLDGTLFHLNIDWDNFKKQPQAIQQQIELAGVKSGWPLAGAKATLDALSSKYALAIISRNFRATIFAALETIGFTGEVYIVGKEDVQELKPSPEALLSVLQRFDVSAQEAVVVGDTYHDVEMADAGSVASIILKNPRNAYIPEGADLYIDRLDELQH